jgi:F-type H+-transporting ATPase subunit a
MQEHEIWLTRQFNEHLAGAGNFLLGLAGQHAEVPGHPWKNFIVMQLLVVLLLIVLFAFLRSRLSVDRPGKLQHLFETIYLLWLDTAKENIGEHAEDHLFIFGTLFIFILFSNLIGVIPGLESPTQVPYVPAGCAMLAFVYYNYIGLKTHKFAYIKHFAGPVWWLTPLMIPIEIASHLARPLSLTVRLFANMFAGEKLTLVFLSLTYFMVPAVFMGLHAFVALIQAYVFALLTTLYIAGASAHEH